MQSSEAKAIARRDAVMKLLGTALGGVALAACVEETTQAGASGREIEAVELALSSANYLAFDTIVGGGGLKSNDPGPSATGMITAIVLGYTTVGDGGGGVFSWDAASTAVDNVGTIIQPTGSSTAGRWLRNLSGQSMIDPRWFGANQGTSDNGPAFNAAFTWGLANGMKTVLVPPGDWPLTTEIAMTAHGQRLMGFGEQSRLLYSGERFAVIMGNGIIPTIQRQMCENFAIQLQATSAVGCIKCSGCTRSKVLNMYLSSDFEGGVRFGEGVRWGRQGWINEISGGQFTALEYGVRVVKDVFATDALDPDATGVVQSFNSCKIGGTLEIYACVHGIVVGDTDNSNTGTHLGSGLEISDSVCIEDCKENAIWIADGNMVNVHHCYFESNAGHEIRVGKSELTSSPLYCRFSHNFHISVGVPAYYVVERASLTIIEQNYLLNAPIPYSLLSGANVTWIHGNHVNATMGPIADAGQGTIYDDDDGSVLRKRSNAEIPVIVDGQTAVTNGALHNSPRLRLRGHYDSNPASPGVTDASMDGVLSMVPTAGGTTPAGFLQLQIDFGGELRVHKHATDTDGYVQSRSRLVPSRETLVLDAVTTIFSKRDAVDISITSNVTSTATPTIQAGIVNGQEIELYNPTTFTYTIQDNGTLGGSGLRLTAATVAIAPRNSVMLRWSAALGQWRQSGPLVAVL